MSQVIGFIEIETVGYESADLAASLDDTTIDGLFARLIGQPVDEQLDQTRDDSTSSMVIRANLDSLSDDLQVATRDVLAGIFLSLGRR
jgi:hypothetical protein